jgi:hypothetical protein
MLHFVYARFFSEQTPCLLKLCLTGFPGRNRRLSFILDSINGFP